MHLQDLRSVEPKIVAMGYTVLFLSTDRPALLYSSLERQVDYHILSDSSMQAAHAFKVAYRLDDKTVEKMLSLGVDLNAAQGTDARELPVPFIFIIDRTGVIRLRHYDADYRVRLDAASVVAAAEQVRH
jgi:peroxiredoxin